MGEERQEPETGRMPADCDELADHLLDVMVDTNVLDPDQQARPANPDTQNLTCVLTGRLVPPDIDVRALTVNYTYISDSSEAVGNAEMGEHLSHKAKEALQDRGHIDESCRQPVATTLSGAQLSSWSCTTVTASSLVTAARTVADPDNRSWWWISAEIVARAPTDLVEAQQAAESLALAAAGAMSDSVDRAPERTPRQMDRDNE